MSFIVESQRLVNSVDANNVVKGLLKFVTEQKKTSFF